jgi:glycolate oxidase
VVPRSKLPEAVRRIQEIGARHRVRVANVCHAGDGNLHPLLLFDPADEAEVARMHEAGKEILRMCIDLGGALTGEHGVGMEKRSCMPWLFSADDLDQFARVRAAFDPAGLCNPEKMFPTGARCGDLHVARKVRTGGWL